MKARVRTGCGHPLQSLLGLYRYVLARRLFSPAFGAGPTQPREPDLGGAHGTCGPGRALSLALNLSELHWEPLGGAMRPKRASSSAFSSSGMGSGGRAPRVDTVVFI